MGILDRIDGWVNVLTGWGLANRDKRSAGTFGQAVRLDKVTLEELYRGDAIAAKIVDVLPDDMVREGFALSVGDDTALAQAIVEAVDDLHGLQTFHEALVWSRLYGGAGVILGVDDGQEPDKPLNEGNIRAIRFLLALDRHQLRIASRYEDPREPKYGEPETYRLQPVLGSAVNAGQTIHESRVLRFDGVPVPAQARLENEGWGDPVLCRLFNAIRGYANAHDFSLAILQDFSQGVLKLRGLAAKLAANDDQAILKRLQALDLGRSTLRSLVLDENDEYERKATPVTGLDKIVEAAERRLCAETGIPHTKLLGESPGASLGEGGDSESRDWYDLVAAEQEKKLRPPLTRLITLLLKSREGPTRGREPEQWSLSFRPLWQLDEMELAEIRSKQAAADRVYLEYGVLSPNEVAVSRFGGTTWSGDTVLDLEARRAATEIEEDEDEDE